MQQYLPDASFCTSAGLHDERARAGVGWLDAVRLSRKKEKPLRGVYFGMAVFTY
ncbi:MAG: hypothetical protein FWG62_01030 [Proteobacteria bacterium]|nr:hypothetical protein [Pseudomonadota bacterium]